MKKILLFFFILISVQMFAQKDEVLIYAQRKHIGVSLNADNNAEVLQINSKLKPAEQNKLKIQTNSSITEKGWKRSFEIYDAADNSIAKISAGKLLTYEISLKDLLPKLKKGRPYFLYTTSLPTDPNIAATVRVRRILVCRIMVK